VIQHKISHGVQSRQGAICRSSLLTVTTTLRQQGRDIWDFLEQAWITHNRGGVMPSLLPEPERVVNDRGVCGRLVIRDQG
jgi:transposase